jgi:hypothetical protein
VSQPCIGRFAVDHVEERPLDFGNGRAGRCQSAFCRSNGWASSAAVPTKKASSAMAMLRGAAMVSMTGKPRSRASVDRITRDVGENRRGERRRLDGAVADDEDVLALPSLTLPHVEGQSFRIAVEDRFHLREGGLA